MRQRGISQKIVEATCSSPEKIEIAVKRFGDNRIFVTFEELKRREKVTKIISARKESVKKR